MIIALKLHEVSRSINVPLIPSVRLEKVHFYFEHYCCYVNGIEIDVMNANFACMRGKLCGCYSKKLL